jgi:hypothetical protein
MRKFSGILALAAVIFTSLSASANVGVPMVAVFLPPLWLSLIPIIAVEAWVVKRKLELPVSRSLSAVALGNVLSSIVGIPLMWGVLATIEAVFADEARGLDTIGRRVYAVTVQAPWLLPYESDLRWMIPSALLVLAVPAYLLSVLIEWRVLLPFVATDRRLQVLRATAVANAASYGLLVVLFAGMLLLGNHIGMLGATFEPVTEWLAGAVFAVARHFLGVP